MSILQAIPQGNILLITKDCWPDGEQVEETDLEVVGVTPYTNYDC